MALAILSSDALSSVAYGPEAMLAVLALAGSTALGLSLKISVAIVVWIIAVGLSYRQLIRAYPQAEGPPPSPPRRARGLARRPNRTSEPPRRGPEAVRESALRSCGGRARCPRSRPPVGCGATATMEPAGTLSSGLLLVGHDQLAR